MKDIIIKSQDIISQKEACKLLDISITQLCKFASKQHIRFVKDKCNMRPTYVLKSDVETLLNSRFYIV